MIFASFSSLLTQIEKLKNYNPVLLGTIKRNIKKIGEWFRIFLLTTYPPVNPFFISFENSAF
jgi:hypothetical protein